MPVTVHHKAYQICVIQALPLEPRRAALGPAWFQNPVDSSPEGIPIFAIPLGNSTVCGILLHPERDVDKVASYLGRILAAGGLDAYAEGGLSFIDLVDGSVMRTNWDIGETEEWTQLAREITQGRAVTHTFSATDTPIGAWVEDDTVRMQLLDWEAWPNRLETSRQTAPIHIYYGRANFLRQLHEVLGWMHRLSAGAISDQNRELAQLLSVRARTQLGSGDKLTD